MGRNKTRLELRDEHLKDPIVALDKALKCVENSWWSVWGSNPQWPVLASSEVCGKSRSRRAFGPTWIRWIVCVYAQHPASGMFQGVRAAWRALFSTSSRRSRRRCLVARPVAPSSVPTSALPFSQEEGEGRSTSDTVCVCLAWSSLPSRCSGCVSDFCFSLKL